jgi:hypothetical protein
MTSGLNGKPTPQAATRSRHRDQAPGRPSRDSARNTTFRGQPGATIEWSTTEGITTSTSAEHTPKPGHGDQIPLDELIRQTPGAHPITSIDELRSDAFETDEELDEFLAFVTESRHADLA